MTMQTDRRAVIHLAWCLADETRRLIFGGAEILQPCFPPIRGHPFRSLRGKQGAPSLYVARFPMSATEAECWFETAAKGDLRLPHHPDRQTAGDGQPLVSGPFRREPENGSQSSARDLPFLPAVHGVMAASGLFSTEDPAFPAEIAKESQAAWLRENMFIDLAEHPEFMGSLIMVRHPPVVRDVGSHLGFNDGREVERVRIRRWPGTDLAGYKVLAVEQRSLGLGVPRELTADRPVMELDWNGKSDKTALVVMHPVSGLAWWREPLGFLRSIQMNLDLIRETRRIVQSVDAEGKVRQHYDVRWRGSGDAPLVSVVGEHTDGQDLSSRVWRAEARRNQLRMAASLGLRWFDDADAAQRAIREIIGNARRTFTVIDPYFGPEQIRDFAMAVTAGDVSIRIVTSEEHLRREPGSGGEPLSVVMERILAEFGGLGWAEPEVLVMRGRHAPLHARFLIADGRVWLSGNSLNAIGKRASMLIELPNPKEVLDHLSPIMEQAERFSAWRSDVRACTGPAGPAHSNPSPRRRETDGTAGAPGGPFDAARDGDRGRCPPQHRRVLAWMTRWRNAIRGAFVRKTGGNV